MIKKPCNLIGREHFGPYLRNKNFPKYEICARTENNINFFQIEKTLLLAHFRPIFPILGAKKIFPENPALSHTTSNGILVPCQNLEKIDDTIPRKRPDRRKDGRKHGTTDRRTGRPYFIGPFRLPPGVQKRDSGTDVFLLILRNFQEHLFLQNTSGGCFSSSF